MFITYNTVSLSEEEAFFEKAIDFSH